MTELIILSAVWFSILLILTSRHKLCRHKYGMWSEWVVVHLNYHYAKFVRYTTCKKCGHLRECELDRHYCTRSTCSHLQDLRMAFSHVDRIEQLEKELGI